MSKFFFPIWISTRLQQRLRLKINFCDVEVLQVVIPKVEIAEYEEYVDIDSVEF